MRLKKIKLAGFKSFVDPTLIAFPGNLLGIVGPNGCGKSNIVDAVKWVIGESSAKTLRGETMADVIFSGSNTRKPVGAASVELVFDNRDGKLGGQYAAFNEISVKRTVSRDGTSQYGLNGTKCRRRDITDVFLGTGLGGRSYAIIEQGMISKLIEAKPEELRVYLEEAAGISRYKERRRETSSRIQSTRENLERLTDQRTGLEKQLNHLKHQSEAAEKYKVFKQQERQTKAELLALRWRELDTQAEERQQAIKQTENILQKAVTEQRELETSIEKSRAKHEQADEAINGVQQHYYQCGAEITRLETAIKHTQDSQQQQQQELLHLHQQLSEVRAHVEQDKKNLQDMQRQLAEAEPQLDEAKAMQQQGHAVLSESEQAMEAWQQSWQAIHGEISQAQQTVQVETTHIDHIQRQIEHQIERIQRIQEEQKTLFEKSKDDELRQLRERQQILEESENRLQSESETGLNALAEQRSANAKVFAQQDASREFLQQIRAELAVLQSVQNTAYGATNEHVVRWLEANELSEASRLAQILQVDAGWERAVEAVLGHFLEAVCVTDENEIAEKLNELAAGRIALIGQTTTESADVDDERLLHHKIKSSANLSGLLHQVYAAQDLASALSMRATLPAGASIVIADGICLGHGWCKVAVETDQGGILQRERQIQSLTTSITDEENEYAALTAQVEEGRTRNQQLEAQHDENQTEISALYRQLFEVRTDLNSSEMSSQQLAQHAERLQADITAIQTGLSESKTQLCEAYKRLNESSIQRQSLEEKKLNLDNDRDKIAQALQKARAASSQCDEQVNKTAMHIDSLTKQHQSMRHQHERMLEQQNHLEERKWRLEQPADNDGEPLEVMQNKHEKLLQERQRVEQKLNDVRTHAQNIEHELREFENKRRAAEQAVQDKRELVEQAKAAWQEINIRCQGLTEQLQEQQHDLQHVLRNLQPQATKEEWDEKLTKLERRIARLGAINLAAIDEYKTLLERKVYLDKQDADLQEALATLESAIHKIDRETRTKFKDTFNRVNNGMQRMFPRFFGGGSGYLELTDDDLLETGVKVMGRPPGKRNSSIHLLSGGEKAMTAVSLLFSLFQLNPAPFCMLDEIDASLDDANVGRFCEVVKEMSIDIQFIFVTHSKTTMEIAGQLLGVTMQEAGVSRLVTVDVDEAVKMAS